MGWHFELQRSPIESCRYYDLEFFNTIGHQLMLLDRRYQCTAGEKRALREQRRAEQLQMPEYRPVQVFYSDLMTRAEIDAWSSGTLSHA